MSFEREVEAAVIALRKALAAENISNFRLDVEASGRTEAGDAKIEYVLSTGGYGSGESCRCGSLAAATEELIRRNDWHNRHAATLLSAPPVDPVPAPPDPFDATRAVVESEIPF